MTENTYRLALQELRDEQTQLTNEREQIDRRLAFIESTIASLSAVVDNDPLEGGLADACRQILAHARGRPMSPLQIRDELKRFGYDLNRHPNEMAAIHGVLKRIAKSEGYSTIGNNFYLWTGRKTVSLKDLVPVKDKK